MDRRFRLLAVTVATASALAATLARRGIGSAWRRFRTSSSPSVGLYELLAGAFLRGYYDGIARDCMAALAGVGAPSVLEIGPGPGHLAEVLLAARADLRWTGLDVDPAMLDATRVRLSRVALADRATFVVGDVTSIPAQDATFDLVVSSLSAHHWPDAAAGFAQIRRVLRSGGRALVYDLPSRWGRLETGSSGIRAAREVAPASVSSRFRGIGPLTLVSRVEIRAL